MAAVAAAVTVMTCTVPAAAANIYFPAKIKAYEKYKSDGLYHSSGTVKLYASKKQLTKTTSSYLAGGTKKYTYKSGLPRSCKLYSTKYTYSYANGRVSLRKGGGARWVYKYSNGRLTEVTDNGTNMGGSWVTKYTFSNYDSNGNPRRIVKYYKSNLDGSYMREVITASYSYNSKKAITRIYTTDTNKVHYDGMGSDNSWTSQKKYICSGSVKLKKSAFTKIWLCEWYMDYVLFQ